mgnify:FL=1
MQNASAAHCASMMLHISIIWCFAVGPTDSAPADETGLRLNNPQSAVKRRCILTTPHGPRPCNPATISVSDVPVSDLGLYAHQLALRQTVRVTKLRGLVGLTSWKTGQQLHPHTRLGLRQGAGQLVRHSGRPGPGRGAGWLAWGMPSMGWCR